MLRLLRSNGRLRRRVNCPLTRCAAVELAGCTAQAAVAEVNAHRIDALLTHVCSRLGPQIARETGVAPDKQRYWTMKRRSNGTYRLARHLSDEEQQLPLMDLREYRCVAARL